MKIIFVFASFFLIQIFCQETVTTVDREVCLKAGITDNFLPETVPVPITDVSLGGVTCRNNSCCTADYLSRLSRMSGAIFRECITDTFDNIIEVAEEFFNNFQGFFGDLARKALYSSFASGVGIRKCKNRYYIDNNILFLSRLLANSTYQLLRGEIEASQFRDALQEYSCGFLASVVQKKYYKRTLHLGRISGDCLCNLTVPGTDFTVGRRVSGVISSRIEPLVRIIRNIFRLIEAISDIRNDSLGNLVEARNFTPSAQCIRVFVQTLGCQHCRGVKNLTCPDSCQKVAQFCLEPLKQGFSQPYEEFIRILRLVLNALTRTSNGGRFHLHSIHRLANQLISAIRRLATEARRAFLAAAVSGDRIEDHKCFYSREYDLDRKVFKCQDSIPQDEDNLTPLCTRTDNGRDEPKDEKVFSHPGRKSGKDSDSDSDTDSGTDTDTDSGTDSDTDSGTDSDTDDDDGLTDAEKRLRKILLKFLSRFRRFSNFRLIFDRISRCICRQIPSRCEGNLTNCDDTIRPSTLYVGSPPYCLDKYPDSVTTDNFEDNAIYQSLSESERMEFIAFRTQTGSNFQDIEQLIANDPELTEVFNQLMDDQSSHGNLFSISLLLLLSSLTLVLLLLLLF